MEANKFIVDLGELTLNDEQRTKINAAIQKAVTGELAGINLTKQIALVPVKKLAKGPIINGIIAVELNKQKLDNLVRGLDNADAFGF